MAVSLNVLMEKLNATTTKALLEGLGEAVKRTHFNLELEHWLLALLDRTNNDLAYLLRQYDIDARKVKRELEKAKRILQEKRKRAGD